jgi:hypothetical protein
MALIDPLPPLNAAAASLDGRLSRAQAFSETLPWCRGSGRLLPCDKII